MNKTGYVAVILVVWNAVVFAMYGLDKRKSRGGGRRVSEKALLTAAAFLGGPGALLGMFVFRHKTKHLKFKIGVPLLLIVNISVVVMLYLRYTAK